MRMTNILGTELTPFDEKTHKPMEATEMYKDEEGREKMRAKNETIIRYRRLS